MFLDSMKRIHKQSINLNKGILFSENYVKIGIIMFERVDLYETGNKGD